MPNFFLSHKRAKVAGRMARPFRRGRRPCRPGFEANAPRSGPRTAGFSDEVGLLDKERKCSGRGALQERLGDEAVHRMDRLGRAGSRGPSRKWATLGAI